MIRILLLLEVILCFSCKDKITQNIPLDNYQYDIYFGKELVLHDTVILTDTLIEPQIANGNYMVFRYAHTSDPYQDAIDDESSEILMFQVPLNVDSCIINDITSSRCITGQFFSPMGPGWLLPDSGIISVVKQSSSAWFVTASIYSPIKRLFKDTIITEEWLLKMDGIFTINQ